MKVLITGGCGFVGRHFTKRLLDDGHTVAIVDDLSSGIERHDWMFQPNSLDNLQLMISDCRAWFRAAAPGTMWSADKFDLIIHCAAIVGGRIKIEEQPLQVATDLAIDSEFFQWIAECRAVNTKVVYFSSSAVYPLELQTRERHLPLSEAFVNFNTNRWSKPDFTYGFVKLAGEYLAHFAREKYGLQVAVYRPFGGYGEDQALSYPFPSIIRRVVNGENPVIVWGSGEQQRDFIHIDDIVECVLQTYDKLDDKPLNIGTGMPMSFFALAEESLAWLGSNATTINDPTKPEGVFSRVSDPFEMEKLYKPRITLEEGIKRALDRARSVK